MNRNTTALKTIYGLAGLLLLSSCSLGTGATRAASGVEGLEIASQVSLVEAQAVTTSPSVSLRSGLAALMKKAITTDESTAYYTDPLDVWVFDESMDSLGLINEILCSFDQTRYADKVNAGTYIALVDVDACSKSTDHSSSQNDQSDSENITTFEQWIVDSVRLSNDDPQEVSVWIVAEGGEFEPAMTIHVKMTITEGKSDTRPYGAFHMDFRMLDPTETTTLGEGYLETVDRSDGQIEFQFSLTGQGDFAIRENAHVVTSVDGATGYAATSFEESFGGETHQGAFQVAFTDDLYYSVDSVSGEESCLNRQDFQNYVFRYGVYNEDGSRLEVSNSGFGIKYNDDYGWAGYYGIWLPEDVEVVSGLTLKRASNDDSSGETFTTIVAPGKLIKHTKETTTLGKIKGAAMNYFDDSTRQMVRVTWNGTNLVIDAVQICQE
ncbi:MAG: hypothetical protein HYY44_09405, partial [Deltaproteobacteria bacterium]|nr:hypothetical protein [Deltaproteobacteria bacterium]